MELSEHPFGVVKRIWGLGQFLCRGNEMVTGEIALAFLAFNLRRVVNILGVKKLVDAIKTLHFLLKTHLRLLNARLSPCLSRFSALRSSLGSKWQLFSKYRLG